MRILVTGSEGYLGSLVTPELMKAGQEVIGLDTGFFKERMLYRGSGNAPLTIGKDLRQVGANDLKGMDAVVHMAELSNDPAGQPAHQMTQRSCGAIGAPALQENAAAKSGLSETGPFTRHCAVECGLVWACSRAASGR